MTEIWLEMEDSINYVIYLTTTTPRGGGLLSSSVTLEIWDKINDADLNYVSRFVRDTMYAA